MPLFRTRVLHPPFKAFMRYLLSDAYGCADKWNGRLTSKYLGNLSVGDLGTQILYRLSNEAPVTPLDYDIFVNKVQLSDKTFLDFLENITYKFRETQNSLNILPSTRHAMVRIYIHHNEEYRLLELLKKRAKTGVFLDEFSANLLLDRFIKKRDYPAGLSVMWELCLQSHLERESLMPYLTALWLHTASELIKSAIFCERTEVVVAVDDEDDTDIDYRRVPYLRNPNYDGWFDIERPRLQFGHCLLSLTKAIDTKAVPLLPKETINCLKSLVPSLRLLAFALLEDPNQLLALASSKSLSLDSDILKSVEKLIESCDRRPDDSEVKRGEPILLTESEVASTLKKFKEIASTLPRSEQDFHSTLSKIVTAIITDPAIQKEETVRLARLYDMFESKRAEVWQAETEKMRRREVLATVKDRLRALADEEERLTFFDNTDAIEYRAWLAPRTRSERHWSRLKEWKKDLKEYQQRKQGDREALDDS